MKRVLVATDDRTFSVSLCDAYRARGYEVDLGVSALWLDLKAYDIIHLHWPEELIGWAMPPRADAILRLTARLEALRSRSKLVATVHNLLPHGAPRYEDGAGDLYNRVYLLMDRIGHFSRTSVAQVSALFPDVPAARHILCGMNDFRDLKRHAIGREASRAVFGVEGDDIVIGLLGNLRSVAEVSLVCGAIDRANINATILFAARPPHSAGRIKRRLAQMRLARWKQRHNVITYEGFVDDAAMVAMCEAMDMLFIARTDGHLNSGLVPLAMTFGTPLVAPDFGVFSETMAGSDNELYAPGDATAAARAIDCLAAKPLAKIRHSNQAMAHDWNWQTGLDHLLSGLEDAHQ